MIPAIEWDTTKRQALEIYLAHLKRRVAEATGEREKALLLILVALTEATIKSTPK